MLSSAIYKKFIFPIAINRFCKQTIVNSPMFQGDSWLSYTRRKKKLTDSSWIHLMVNMSAGLNKPELRIDNAWQIHCRRFIFSNFSFELVLPKKQHERICYGLHFFFCIRVSNCGYTRVHRGLFFNRKKMLFYLLPNQNGFQTAVIFVHLIILRQHFLFFSLFFSIANDNVCD